MDSEVASLAHLSGSEAAVGVALGHHPAHDGQGLGDETALQVRQQGVGRHLDVDRLRLAGPRVGPVALAARLGPRLELAGVVGRRLQHVEGRVARRVLGQVQRVRHHGQRVRVAQRRQLPHQKVHGLRHGAAEPRLSLKRPPNPFNHHIFIGPNQ